ncbi:Isopropyl malate synthase [Fulvia fulva]|nr:Isopropyl malate synthase [Fulvia fulva]WPV26670.1 Isopropyl malate synthase [Fulvia fulva]
MSAISNSGTLTLREKYGDRVPAYNNRGRKWPDAVLEKCPILLSTDLRDGNQSLRIPMTFAQKLRFYHLIVSIGFKEIEIGHPCANDTEFEFIRHLVDTQNLIADDLLVRVIAPCSEEAVERAMQSVNGAPKAVIFTYLPSSNNYRETVLGISENDWVDRAVRVTRYVRSLTHKSQYRKRTKWAFNFGFEDYANARLEAVIGCAEAVKATWRPSREEPMIFFRRLQRGKLDAEHIR